jgi:hypothetical protein
MDKQCEFLNHIFGIKALDEYVPFSTGKIKCKGYHTALLLINIWNYVVDLIEKLLLTY